MSSTAPTVAPFGSWDSPISAQTLVSGATGCNEAIADRSDVWWAESRPDEGGRTVLVRWRNGAIADMSPADIDVRTRAHEYGGGAWTVANGLVVFSDDATGRLFLINTTASPIAEPLALTPEPALERGWRFADMQFSPDRRFVLSVREDHHDETRTEPRNQIVSVAADGSGSVTVLVDGPDFVSTPRPSPDGQRLAWLQWNHPAMPWDNTEMGVATLTSAGSQPPTLGPVSVLAGGPPDDAAAEAGGADGVGLFQPTWTSDGTLIVVSDQSNWGNIIAIPEGGDSSSAIAVTTGEVEIGTPHWVFGMSRIAVTPTGDVWFSGATPSGDELGLIPAAALASALEGTQIGRAHV